MQNHSESIPRSKIVRWTADEWACIASQLYVQKRAVLFDPWDLGQIKAKDVFLAQQVLPPDRCRKLVSIAQGFDAIRVRLRTILKGLPHTEQHERFRALRPDAKNKESGEDLKSCPHERIKEGARALPPQISANETAGIRLPQPNPEFEETLSSVVDSAGVRHPAQRIAGVGEQTVKQTSTFNVTSEDQGGRLGQEAPAAHHNMPAPILVTISLTELAWPFVAMVCEEFARALVRVIATHGPSQPLQAETQKALGKGIASKQAACNEWRGVDRLPGVGPDETILSKTSSAANRSQPTSFAEVFDNGQSDMDEDDVQPLFDPKLPPSANSDVKPNIGVVTTHASDLMELSHLYPQLNLTIVQAEAVSDVRRFGHCQRIIALRDEIPIDTDELLGRLLRHRYVRLGGGVGAVKEQLNAWLDAPGSITFVPKRTVPGFGKAPYSNMAKKKPNRHPRMVGR